MLNYAHMDDIKIEPAQTEDQAVAEAIAAIFKRKQNLPVIVF